MAQHRNRLAESSSPYLLQHAANPVDWWQWGEAALAEAAAGNRPILLSIGYAACHWCHVMAHESFENGETAALMNRLFVNIKVDREERPDIDHLYMSALHALGEQGGWPLTMFLAPDGTPFWGGTYFPPEPRWGRPSFRQVLTGVAHAWANEADTISGNRASLLRALAAQSALKPGEAIGAAQLDDAATRLLRALDPVHGGMRGAPKFPNPPIFRFLWQSGYRTGQNEGCEAVHHLLRAMSLGGIYDHLGGGYARYATDAEWLVPHFEKMLYDNAQILELLAFAYAGRPEPLYRARAAETVAWLTRDMLRQDGATFAASEDADSEGEEGRFYVWTRAEIVALLGEHAEAFCAAYDVTDEGNWEGKTILRLLQPAQAEALAQSRAILLGARAKRIRPGRDDKLLADWNGLLAAALAKAAAVFARPDWLDLAERAFDGVLAALGQKDGRIAHTQTAAGLLEDQAAMARAALALYQARGNPKHLATATAIANATVIRFTDGAGAFYMTADDATGVPLGAAARPRLVGDNATPAGNGVLAEVFATLYACTGEAKWRKHAEDLLKAFAGYGAQLSAMPTLLNAADLLQNAAAIVIAGAELEALTQAALASPDPATIVLRLPQGAILPQTHPAYGKTGGEAGAQAYLCRGNACLAPVNEPEALAALLRLRRVQ
jgi:uncharacterized protein YyaL (SSP411 family)